MPKASRASAPPELKQLLQLLKELEEDGTTGLPRPGLEHLHRFRPQPTRVDWEVVMLIGVERLESRHFVLELRPKGEHRLRCCAEPEDAIAHFGALIAGSGLEGPLLNFRRWTAYHIYRQAGLGILEAHQRSECQPEKTLPTFEPVELDIPRV